MRSLLDISSFLVAIAPFRAPAAAFAQAVSVSISPLAPYGEFASGKGACGGASSAVALYAMAFLDSVGTVQCVDLEERQGFHFASVNLLFRAGTLRDRTLAVWYAMAIRTTEDGAVTPARA